jgi:hypothetical protein
LNTSNASCGVTEKGFRCFALAQASESPGNPEHMMQLSNALVVTSLFAVAAVLFLGLFNMLRGGSTNLSQKLMRWRVGLQLLAIVIVMGVLWMRG